MSRKFIWNLIKAVLWWGILLGSWALAEAQDGAFGARISRINTTANLMRLRVKFKNIKFLNQRDHLELWSGHRKDHRCSAYVLGKSNEYLLIKVPNLAICIKRVQLAVGVHVTIESKDLANNMKVAREVVEILLKKRLGLQARWEREKKELDRYLEKVEAVNSRFEVLKSKLELEWQEELGHLQEDKVALLKRFKNTEIQLGEIDHKLEQYKIHDKNFELDRWSLDSRLYYNK